MNDIESPKPGTSPNPIPAKHEAPPYWHIGRLLLSLIVCVLIVIAVAAWGK